MRVITRVEWIAMIAENTFEVVLHISDQNFKFKAGQYITVTLPNLKQLPIREQFRDFSIASSPNYLPRLSISFRKSESAFKKELLQMKKGDEVIIEGPSGIFTLPDIYEKPIVFIAGGIGIDPFMSMLEFATENNLPHKITVLYCNRSHESAAYLEKLDSLSKQNPLIKIVRIFGPLEEKHIADLPSQNPLWYIAGPPGMVETARAILLKLGIIETDIKTEEFTGY